MHMSNSIRRTLGAALVASLVVLGGVSCDSPTALRTGQISLLLTDAPGDIVKAVVTIEQVYLQGAGDESPRTVLRDEPLTVDLLTLADVTMDLVDGLEIRAGTYGQLRFVISGAYIEVEGATETETMIYASSPAYSGLPDGAAVDGALQMPSFAQTGLKVNLPGDAIVVVADDHVTLVVDFDVSQSFGQQAGASGMWVMTPVLNGFVPPSE